MEILLVILIFWVLPIWVGHLIGKSKRRSGWLWGLLLGWIGVIIVALLPRKESRHEAALVTNDFVTFRPRIVTGAMEPGYTYGFRLSDHSLLRQATGSDQWVEVKNAQERFEVLEAIEQRAST